MNAVEVRQVVIVKVAPVHVSNRTGIVLFYIPEQNPDPSGIRGDPDSLQKILCKLHLINESKVN